MEWVGVVVFGVVWCGGGMEWGVIGDDFDWCGKVGGGGEGF